MKLFTAFLQYCWRCDFRLRTLALLGRPQISLEGIRTKPSRAYQRKWHLNEEHVFFSSLAQENGSLLEKRKLSLQIKGCLFEWDISPSLLYEAQPFGSLGHEWWNLLSLLKAPLKFPHLAPIVREHCCLCMIILKWAKRNFNFLQSVG